MKKVLENCKKIGNNGNKKMLYGSYGSNLNIEQMNIRCPFASVVGNGVIKDYELVFNYHANIEEVKGSNVPIVVWNINKYDEYYLDCYEGFP